MFYIGLYKNEVRLNKPRDILRLLQRVMNGLLKDKDEEGYVPINNARAIFYGASVMLKGMETTELEQRIEELEKIAAEQNKK